MVFIALFFLTPCLYAETYTISNTTNDIGKKINGSSSISKNSILAIISIKSLSVELTNHIITLIETSILSGDNIRIVSRNRIEEVLLEIDFNLTGLIDDNTAQRIGHLLGAKYVLTGDLTRIENKYILSIQVLETETGLINYSNQYEIKNSELKYYERLVVEKERTERLQRESLVRQENERQKKAIKREKQSSSNYEPFKNYHLFSDTAMLGYYFSLDSQIGMTVGYWGIYSNFGLGGKDDPQYFNYSITVGYNFTIIPDRLYFPLGLGGGGSSLDSNSLSSTEYPDYSYFIIEPGLLVRIRSGLYLKAQYRYLVNYKHSFGVGIGWMWWEEW
jgi:TolB-like protein